MSQSLLLTSGTIVDAKYEVLELLGSGGYGSVYKAKQIGMERPVALKLLHIAATEDQENIERFRREGLAMAAFQHANIPTIYQFGVWQSRIPYIAMEYLQGHSLRTELSQQEKLNQEKAIAITQQICSALSYAHTQGVIHRDLKPENIFLTRFGTDEKVKVCDFGLAKFLPQSKHGSELETLTATGLLIGSSSYMSPEQCNGKKSDERSDIYSLACILFEMLTGHPPFVAENPIASIHMHINESIPELANDPELNKIVWKGLQKDPANRYQAMTDMAADLTLVQQGLPLNITVSKATARPKFLIIAISCAVLTACVFAFAILTKRHSENNLETARIQHSSTALTATRYIAQGEKLAKHDDKLDEAAKAFKNALSICEKLPNNSERTALVCVQLSRVQQRQGLKQDALASAKKAFLLMEKEKPSDKRHFVDAIDRLSDALESTNELEAAIKYRRMAIGFAFTKQHSLYLKCALAYELFRAGQYGEAKEISQAILEQDDVLDSDTAIRTNFLLANIFAMHRDRSKAQKYTNAGIEEARHLLSRLDSPGESAFTAEQLANDLIDLARIYAASGDIKSAANIANQILELNHTHNFLSNKDIAIQFVGIAQTIAIKGSYREASSMLESFIKLSSNVPQLSGPRETAVQTLSDCYLLQGQFDKGTNLMKIYLSELPDIDNAQAQWARGKALCILAKYNVLASKNEKESNEILEQAMLIDQRYYVPTEINSLILKYSIADLLDHKLRYSDALPRHKAVLSALALPANKHIPIEFSVRSLRSMAHDTKKLKNAQLSETYYKEGTELAEKNKSNQLVLAEYKLMLLQEIELYETLLKRPDLVAKLKQKAAELEKQ
jgi:serine/threonine protein kinase